jgi:alanine dehydrogenase
MIIGVPKEIKNNENRVGMTPAGVTAFVNSGHEVWIETMPAWEADFMIAITN